MRIEKNNEIIESVEKITSTFSAIFCEANDDIADILKNEQVSTVISTINDVSQELSEAITYIDFMRKVASIPTKLFMSKFERYVVGIIDIPYDKRQKYLKKSWKNTFKQGISFYFKCVKQD